MCRKRRCLQEERERHTHTEREGERGCVCVCVEKTPTEAPSYSPLTQAGKNLYPSAIKVLFKIYNYFIVVGEEF